MGRMREVDSSSKGIRREIGNTSKFCRKETLDFFRPEQIPKATLSSPTLAISESEGFPSSQTLETNERRITPFKENASPASALLRQIKLASAVDQRTVETDMKKRLTRITGKLDFLEENPKHSEVVKMRYAIARKMQASRQGQWLDFYFAHKDLEATEAALIKEAKMMNVLESGARGLKHIEGLLNNNDHAIRDETVMESIRILNADLSRIQEKQNKIITQWEKLKGDIEPCISKLKQHAPDLPLPDLDKVLIFPKGKPKENGEQLEKTEKETKKGDQLPTSDDQAESAAKTTTHQTPDISAEAKASLEKLGNLHSQIQWLHGELTSLNNQWDNFADKRKQQMDQLKSSRDLQSKRISEAISTSTAGTNKEKSDIAAAMKHANRIVALAALTLGGGALRVRV